MPASTWPAAGGRRFPAARTRCPGTTCCQPMPPRITTGASARSSRPPVLNDVMVASTAQRDDRSEPPCEVRARGAPAISTSARHGARAAMAAATGPSCFCADDTAECAAAATASSIAAAMVSRKLRPARPSGPCRRVTMTTSKAAPAAIAQHSPRSHAGLIQGPVPAAAHTRRAGGTKRRSTRRRPSSAVAAGRSSGDSLHRISSRRRCRGTDSGRPAVAIPPGAGAAEAAACGAVPVRPCPAVPLTAAWT